MEIIDRSRKNQPQKQNHPLEVYPIQWMIINQPDFFHERHRTSSFEIIFIRRGTATIAIDEIETTIGEGDICCITPGQIFLLNTGKIIEGYFLSFSSEFLCHQNDTQNLIYDSGLFYANSKKPVVLATGELGLEVQKTLERMISESDNSFLLRSELLKGLLKIFLIDLSRLSGKPCHAIVDRRADLVKRYLVLLDKNYTSRKMVIDYAEELAVTPSNLNEIVKKVTGFPASYHIQQRVAIEAKRQAVYEVSSMKEVALNLGFDDFAHFSRFFKKAVGMNFSDYKRKLASSSVQ